MATKKVSRIAVLTSGGDAPGMNAAIRAVVRTAIFNKIEVYGIVRGYSGMIEDDIYKMDSKSVANIIQRGGTILKSARSDEFKTPAGRKKAFNNLKKKEIDGLVVIGGDGSFTGALKLSEEHGIPVIGLPGTIDKDCYGTDSTIGFDTAVNTAVENIDKIRDTADAHDRLFIVEVMGRDAGYIALNAGIATGAETILLPETKTDIESVIIGLKRKERRKKLVNLIVVAEGDELGGASEVAKVVKERLPKIDTRVTILGHIQRGGSPSCCDRLIASRMGYHAVVALNEGKRNVMIGIQNGNIVHVPLEDAISKKNQGIDQELLKISHILSI
ncbi:6-phosphofructokinase [Haoranjiania flava]|uniref:ATP-dependent 6-phosphofructokinase n=1 Tax=Haoranjiania flava TaxID=1856322 RepID=A0AAE3LKJ2_9BACT|nr:6-phosphofructokinase [Haoranjiania flava]MCU7694977.1 6-phosphofructokinase [Haoranjiania flava]